MSPDGWRKVVDLETIGVAEGPFHRRLKSKYHRAKGEGNVIRIAEVAMTCSCPSNHLFVQQTMVVLQSRHHKCDQGYVRTRRISKSLILASLWK